jgi:hypothetical protein
LLKHITFDKSVQKEEMLQEKQELLEQYERKSMTERMSIKSLSHELKLVPEET